MRSELRHFRISFLAEQFAVFVLEQYYNCEAVHLTIENDQAPYDIDIGGTRFDVKYSQPTYVSAKKRALNWDFDLRKKGHDYCDYFVLVGARNGIFDSVFLVPSADANKRRIRIPLTGNTRWQKYRIR